MPSQQSNLANTKTQPYSSPYAQVSRRSSRNAQDKQLKITKDLLLTSKTIKQTPFCMRTSVLSDHYSTVQGSPCISFSRNTPAMTQNSATKPTKYSQKCGNTQIANTTTQKTKQYTPFSQYMNLSKPSFVSQSSTSHPYFTRNSSQKSISTCVSTPKIKKSYSLNHINTEAIIGSKVNGVMTRRQQAKAVEIDSGSQLKVQDKIPVARIDLFSEATPHQSLILCQEKINCQKKPQSKKRTRDIDQEEMTLDFLLRDSNNLPNDDAKAQQPKIKRTSKQNALERPLQRSRSLYSNLSRDRLFLEDSKYLRLHEFSLFKDEELFPKLHTNQKFQVCNTGIFEKEKECDYESDRECIMKAKAFMVQDLKEALDFFVKGDPIMLVDNI